VGTGAYSNEVTAVAEDAKTGRALGEAVAILEKGAAVLSIAAVNVEKPGCGIGTRLYEALAEEACSRHLQLHSDSDLSNYSRSFWKKQQRKGRAVFVGDHYVIENPCTHAHDLSGVKRKKRSR
jgi:hypothetical protein